MISHFFSLLIQSVRLFINRESDQYAAAVAYFAPFAIIPLLLLSITIVGIIIGREAIVTLLVGWGQVIDPELPTLLSDSLMLFESYTNQFHIPIAALLFFSIMVLVALNSVSAGIHKLWGIEIRSWHDTVRRHTRAVLFVLFLQVYIVSLILLESIVMFLGDITGLGIILMFKPILLLAGTIILFAIGYGLLPLSAPSFTARLYGAMLASVLFLGIRSLVAFHLATAPVATFFGAASIIVVLLMWVYAGATVILFGAAFAKVYDNFRVQRLPTN